jgi:hypothetical protein
MEKNASISMSLLPHLPEDQKGFIHPIVSKSHEVCAVPSLVAPAPRQHSVGLQASVINCMAQ